MKKKPGKKWTLIFLLSAKNNLFHEQLSVINGLYSIGSSDDVDFVILFDAIEGDKFSKGFAAPSIYHVTKGATFISDACFHRLKPSGTGLTDQKNLEKLLKLVIANFPSDKYGFIYKGHGGAGTTDISRGAFNTKMVVVDPKITDDEIEEKFGNAERGWTFEGYCEYPVVTKNAVRKKPLLLIYSRGNSKSLLYTELAEALDAVFKKQLDFICMDCCWAQQIENANTFVGLTNHFIASADEMPALGLGYTHLCKHFINRPAIKAEEVANLLVSIFFYNNYADYDSDVPEFREMGVSLTSVYLEEYEKFLDVFNILCSHLTKGLIEKDNRIYYLFQNARKQCLDYTYKDTDSLQASEIDFPMFNIDLVWLLENLLFYNTDQVLEEKIFNVLYQLQNNIISGYIGNNYKKSILGDKAIGGNGISICFPATKDHAEQSILNNNKMSFYKKTGWKKLLHEYYKYIPTKTKAMPFGPGSRKGFKPADTLAGAAPPKSEQRLVFRSFKH